MRPLSWVGLAIMVVAVFVGFNPTIWSILFLFATTLIGGHYIRKNTDKNTYDYFLSFFGLGVAAFNAVAMILLAFSPLPFADKTPAMFLHFMVLMIMGTLLKIKNDARKDS